MCRVKHQNATEINKRIRVDNIADLKRCSHHNSKTSEEKPFMLTDAPTFKALGFGTCALTLGKILPDCYTCLAFPLSLIKNRFESGLVLLHKIGLLYLVLHLGQTKV